MTVSMVPSLGLPTAPYAAILAISRAWARSEALQVCRSWSASLNPLRNCERITPLFPLAPKNAPWASSLATSPAVTSAPSGHRSMPERRVRNMFVPVSPSGTGNTFSAFTTSRLSSRRSKASLNASRSSAPVSSFVVDKSWTSNIAVRLGARAWNSSIILPILNCYQLQTATGCGEYGGVGVGRLTLSAPLDRFGKLPASQF